MRDKYKQNNKSEDSDIKKEFLDNLRIKINELRNQSNKNYGLEENHDDQFIRYASLLHNIHEKFKSLDINDPKKIKDFYWFIREKFTIDNSADFSFVKELFSRFQLDLALQNLKSVWVEQSKIVSNNPAEKDLIFRAFLVLKTIKNQKNHIPNNKLDLVIDFANETAGLLLDTKLETYKYCNALVNVSNAVQITQHRSWGKPMLAAGVALLGAALLVTSTALLIASCGASAPISLYGIKISADLMMAGAALGAGVSAGFASYAFFSYEKSQKFHFHYDDANMSLIDRLEENSQDKRALF